MAYLGAACRQEAPSSPIPDEKVARIMADLYIAEAAASGYIGYKKDSLSQAYYNQVFQMYGVSREQYQEALNIMARDTPRLEIAVQKARDLVDPEKKDKTAPKEKK